MRIAAALTAMALSIFKPATNPSYTTTMHMHCFYCSMLQVRKWRRERDHVDLKKITDQMCMSIRSVHTEVLNWIGWVVGLKSATLRVFVCAAIKWYIVRQTRYDFWCNLFLLAVTNDTFKYFYLKPQTK